MKIALSTSKKTQFSPECGIFLLAVDSKPAATGIVFDDVPASRWAAAWIEDAANKGFSYGQYGCAPGNFCPAAQVTRAEMAGMLVRTFDLP